MAAPSFVASPAVLGSCGCRGGSLSATPSRPRQRPGTCPVRASSAAPPPPPQPSDSPGGEQGGEAEAAGAARAALEASFSLDIEAGAAADGGKCDCIWCSGSGKRTCAWCRGKGQRDEFRLQSWNEMNADVERYMDGEPVQMPEKIPTVCSACTGTKLLPCGYCRGSGVGSYGMGYFKK